MLFLMMGQKKTGGSWWAIIVLASILKIAGVLGFIYAVFMSVTVMTAKSNDFAVFGLSNNDQVYIAIALILSAAFSLVILFAIAQLMETLISLDGKTNSKEQHDLLRKIVAELEKQSDLLTNLDDKQSPQSINMDTPELTSPVEHTSPPEPIEITDSEFVDDQSLDEIDIS